MKRFLGGLRQKFEQMFRQRNRCMHMKDNTTTTLNESEHEVTIERINAGK